MIHNVPAIERRNQPYSHSWFHKTCYLKGELRTQLASLFLRKANTHFLSYFIANNFGRFAGKLIEEGR